jgi:hypothetical protein
MSEEYDIIEKENIKAAQDDIQEDTTSLEEKLEEIELFPIELEVEMAIAKAVNEGVSTSAIAEAVIAGLKRHDPIQLEIMADLLQDKAFKLQQ